MFDPMRFKLRTLLYTGSAFGLGVLAASSLGWTGAGFAVPAPDDQPRISEEAVRPALDLSEAFVNISTAVTPAVVRIEVARPRSAMGRGGGEIPEEFRRFFNFPDGQDEPRGGSPVRSGGSGFLFSGDGYILTNDHVVSGATEITVFLQDRRQFRATLVGADPTTDVAVIRIEGSDLPTLSLGRSESVRVGEWVLAVGNPGFGSGSQLDYTVTAGIVSAKGRPLGLINRELRTQGNEESATFAIEDFIQTDAVINPGNSGGPLVDLRGQVVGINSAIASQTGFYQGYGFAIPIDLARRVMEDLIEFGAVRRPWLGVRIQDVTPEVAEYYKLPGVSGVWVQGFGEDGDTPAKTAGIQAEDIIIEIDGNPVERVGQLQRLVAQRRPGDEVEVLLYRDGKPRTVQVRLGQAPIAQPASRPAETPQPTVEKLGISAKDMTEELAREYGYEQAGGVVIDRVQPDGPAARQGIGRPGFRILEINRERIRSTADMRRVLDDVTPGQVVSLRVEDPTGTQQVVVLRVPEQ